VVCFGMFVMNDGALMAVKKLYIRLCAARDRRGDTQVSDSIDSARSFERTGCPRLVATLKPMSLASWTKI
jgi:hypothetical protein